MKNLIDYKSACIQNSPWFPISKNVHLRLFDTVSNPSIFYLICIFLYILESHTMKDNNVGNSVKFLLTDFHINSEDYLAQKEKMEVCALECP